ncbi:MAG TPA: YCF48-related protein [Ignavibacteriaceae bacterium]|nr:YCF48-related protein [Ignavibacteriaceae bacterium]
MKKISLLFLAFFLLSSTYAQDMQLAKWLHQKPQGNTLRAVDMFDNNNIYAFGTFGTFMKTSDGGLTWKFNHQVGKKSATGYYYYTIYDAHWFDMNTGIAVGEGGIYRTTNAGATWDSVYNTTSAGASIYQVYFVDNNIGFAAGVSSVKLLKTTDGGLTWAATGFSAAVSCYDIYSDGNLVVVSASSGNIYRSTDGGTTFGSAISTGTSVSLYKITFKNPLVGVVAGGSGSARLTTDGGLTWNSINLGLPSTDTFYDIDFINDDIYLTGDSYALFRSINNGTSWDTVSFLAPVAQQPWTSAHYATDFYNGNFVSVGAFGIINKRIGEIITHHTYFIKPGQLNDVWKDPNSNKIIAVGAPAITGSVFDQIMISTDNGVTWSFATTTKVGNKAIYVDPVEDIPEVKGEDIKTPNSYSTFKTICMLNSNVGFIGGSRGAIYKTTNGGSTWDSLITSIPNIADIYKIDFLNDNFGMAFSNAADTTNGTVFRTTDGGVTWTLHKIPTTSTSNSRLYSGDIVDQNYAWTTTYQPRPVKTTDGGLTWTVQTTSDGYGGFLYDIQMFDTLNGVMCGGSGRFYKTTDGGALWQVIPTGTTSITFNALSFIDVNKGMVVGSNGVIFQTSDGGTTWDISTTGGPSIYGLYLSAPSTIDSVTAYLVGLNTSIFSMKSGIVPVELASFTSSVNGNTVTLNWSTATETNNFGFDVERKVNGTWNKIGFVNGSGTTTERKSYSFTETLNSGKYNYRLKQIDHDGSYKYYNLPEVIEIGLPVQYKLSQNYPNPFNPSTIINYSLPSSGNVSIKVYNIIGKEVATIVNGYQEAGNYIRQFNASENGLSSGVYFYTIKSGSFTDTKKMVILK